MSKTITFTSEQLQILGEVLDFYKDTALTALKLSADYKEAVEGSDEVEAIDQLLELVKE